MKNKTLVYGAALGALLFALASCSGNNGTSSVEPSSAPTSATSVSSTKTLTLKYIDDQVIAKATVTVFDGDTEVAKGKTNTNGIFSFEGEDKAYTIDIEGMPKGYYVDEGLTFPAGTSEFTVTASSSVILEDMPSTTRYAVGDIMYDFEVDTTDDETIALSDLCQEKDLIVLNFWATWCNPCMAEFPYFNAAYIGQDGDEGFQDNVAVITLNTDISLTALKTYQTTKTFFTDFTMACAPSSLEQAFYVEAIPTTVFINKYGRIVRENVGSDPSYESWRKYFSYLSDEETGKAVVEAYDGNALIPTPDSGELEAAACDASSQMTFEKPSDTFFKNQFGSTTYAHKCWPYVVSDDGESIHPSNIGYEGTFAATLVTVDLEAGQSLTVDAMPSCEDEMDYLAFYSYASDNLTYIGYVSGIEDHFETITLLTAEKKDTYQLFVYFVKDDCLDDGDDTVYLKNFTVVDAAA